LLAGLGSLPLTFAGGLLAGVLEGVVRFRFTTIGAQELGMLLAIVGVLVVRRRWETPPAFVDGAGRSARPRRALGAAAPALWSAWRAFLLLIVAAACAFAIFRPIGNGLWAFVLSIGVVYAIQSLSLVLLSGWGGQVALMQGAYAAQGTGGTYITVLPAGDLVIVHQVDIDKNPKAWVPPSSYMAMLSMIVNSYCGNECK